MGAFIGFTLFSALEGIGIYFISMSTFRLKPFNNFNAFLPFLVVMILQSYFLRNEVHFESFVPVVSVLLFILFYTLYLRIPLIWSCIIGFVSYTAFGLIQWLLLELVFGSVEKMNQELYGGYILQTLTAIVLYIISAVLIRYRIGFIADFERFRFKSEKYITISMIVITIIGMVLTAFSNIAMLIIVASFIYFLYFAIKKEKEEQGL